MSEGGRDTVRNKGEEPLSPTEPRVVVFARRKAVHGALPGATMGVSLSRAVFTWEELRYYICGSANISVEMLRAFVNVDGQASAPHIQNFWKAVERFTQAERRALMRFWTVSASWGFM